MKYFLKAGCLQDQFLPKQFGLPRYTKASLIIQVASFLSLSETLQSFAQLCWFMNLWFIGLNIAKWTLLNYFKGTISVSFLPDFCLGYQDEDGIDPIFCKLFF